MDKVHIGPPPLPYLPPSPHKCGLMFFSPLFFILFPISYYKFKKHEKWTWPRAPCPPPLVDLVHKNVFFSSS